MDNPESFPEGERLVQESEYPLLENEVQRTTQFIFTLVIGMSIKIEIFG